MSRSCLQSAVAFGFKVSIVQQPSFSSFRTVHLVDSWERRRLELWDVLSILFKFGQPTGYYQTPWSVPSASPELVPPSGAVLHMPLSHKKDFSEWLTRLCLGKWSSHPSCYFGLTLHPHPASSTHTRVLTLRGRKVKFRALFLYNLLCLSESSSVPALGVIPLSP
ncbi:unnamed protein product [Rangifer tarandus platyrhynchus]|uniref:Uncharacterized protein n=1 Tax=Rangifer tarandus platyrhynchus TaxID=3082113 RepID=A0ABN8YXW1_RANTA|nr:unnamed protein product [Rangifer tarandus platyrhynchus]